MLCFNFVLLIVNFVLLIVDFSCVSVLHHKYLLKNHEEKNCVAQSKETYC